jgi:hypothetical protein
VPANIDPDKYASVMAMVEECFQKYRDLPAFIFMGKTLTFGDLDALSNEFGAYLHSRGLEPGDRIALMMPNMLQYPIALVWRPAGRADPGEHQPAVYAARNAPPVCRLGRQGHRHCRKFCRQPPADYWRNADQNRHPHQYRRNAGTERVFVNFVVRGSKKWCRNTNFRIPYVS